MPLGLLSSNFGFNQDLSACEDRFCRCGQTVSLRVAPLLGADSKSGAEREPILAGGMGVECAGGVAKKAAHGPHHPANCQQNYEQEDGNNERGCVGMARGQPR